MRLLLVAESNSTHTHRWAQFFSNAGWDVLVVSHSNDPIAEVRVLQFPPADSWWARLPREKYGGGWQRWLAGWGHWRKIVRDFSPDIIHIHYLSGEARDYFYYRGDPGLVVSSWGADVVFDEQPPSKSQVRRLRSIFGQAQEVTSTTHFLADATREFTPPGKTIHVIPFGVDCDMFSPADRPRTVNGSQTIGFVKHLEKKYGPEVLLEAFSQVHEAHPGTRLAIAGRGSLREVLQSRIGDLGLEEVVTLPGRIEYSKVPDLLRSFDIFAMPSVYESETFGVAAIEASACEVPVVATRVGGVPEAVVHGKTGILVRPNEVDELASAIIKLVRNPALREEYGRAGRQYVLDNYQWQENASQMEALYTEVMAHKRE